jgi:hypothetical protein
MREARSKVNGLSAGFRYHDYIWPGRDESTKAAVDTVLTAYLTEQRHGGTLKAGRGRLKPSDVEVQLELVRGGDSAPARRDTRRPAVARCRGRPAQ